MKKWMLTRLGPCRYTSARCLYSEAENVIRMLDPRWQTLALWLAAAALVLLLFGLSSAYRRWIDPALARLFTRRGQGFLAVLAESFGRPIARLLTLWGWLLAIDIAPVGAGLQAAAHLLFRLAVIVLCGWGLAGRGQLIAYLLRNTCKRLDTHTGQSVIGFLSSVFKGVVWALVVVIVLSELGYDVNGLLAGLGLGGLTVALAAQESAANFFAGLVLVLERPFEVGDFITYGEMSGTVEEIAFRASRLRTPADTVITVPNSALCTAPITNWSRMRRRLVRFSIGLRYDTPPAVLRQVIDRLQQMLRADPAILPDTAHVHLEGFADSALQLLIRYYIGKPDFEHQFEVNQQVNLAIVQIVHDCGADFAFPSQSVYLEGDKRRETKHADDVCEEGAGEAAPPAAAPKVEDGAAAAVPGPTGPTAPAAADE